MVHKIYDKYKHLFCEKVAYILRNISKECKLIFRFLFLTFFTLTTYLKLQQTSCSTNSHMGRKCEIFCCCHLNKSLHNYKQPVCLQAKTCDVTFSGWVLLSNRAFTAILYTVFECYLIKMTACMFQLKPLKVNQTMKMSSHTGAKKTYQELPP